MTTLDLASAVARTLPLPTEIRAPAEIRDRAIAIWTARMVAETVSSRVFGALVGEAIAAGAGHDVASELADFAAEELEHGLSCARVVVALGGEAAAPLPDLVAVPTHADTSRRTAFLRNILSVACLSETTAVALLSTERDVIGPPALRAVVTSILADEVGHARLGWQVVERMVPTLSPAEQDGLDRYLPVAMQGWIEHNGGFLHRGRSSDEDLRWGIADGEESWKVAVETMTSVIVPRLSVLGLPAADAFASALRSTAS